MFVMLGSFGPSFVHSFRSFSQKSEKLSLFMVFAPRMAAGMSKMDAKADLIVSNINECYRIWSGNRGKIALKIVGYHFSS